MPKKQTSSQGPVGAAFTDVDEAVVNLYNAFMAEVEPDLMTGTIPVLDEIYRDESPEQREARAERYAHAMELYEKSFKAMVDLWQGELQSMKSAAITKSKKKAGKEEKKHLKDISHLIDEA